MIALRTSGGYVDSAPWPVAAALVAVALAALAYYVWKENHR